MIPFMASFEFTEQFRHSFQIGLLVMDHHIFLHEIILICSYIKWVFSLDTVWWDALKYIVVAFLFSMVQVSILLYSSLFPCSHSIFSFSSVLSRAFSSSFISNKFYYGMYEASANWCTWMHLVWSSFSFENIYLNDFYQRGGDYATVFCNVSSPLSFS